MGIIREGRSEGLSVLISLILVGVIVVFSIGVTTLVTESTRQSSNIKQGTTAYYAAEAGLEQALWANQKLASTDSAIGANEQISQEQIGSEVGTKFKIQGNTTGLVQAKVNGNYIIPFPWTGNVPWHGEGAVEGTGGCNPEKPPILNGTGDAKTFTYAGVNAPYNDEKDHPCNWNKLTVGEKAVIPLFGIGQAGITNFDDFKIRVRMPCANGQEFCEPGQRMQLNCFDKGSGEKICKTFNPNSNKNRGEVIMLWQISGQTSDTNSAVVTLNPYEELSGSDKYNGSDTQLYEGKLYNQQSVSKNFEVLNTSTDIFPSAPPGYSFPVGLNLTSNILMQIKDFIDAHYKPTLSLSVVSSLVGCSNPTNCSSTVDKATGNSAYVFHGIPYIEYQIVLLGNANSSAPAGLSNLITAEGQSGAFNQTIQVKVPNDNSTLEYVIQQ